MYQVYGVVWSTSVLPNKEITVRATIFISRIDREFHWLNVGDGQHQKFEWLKILEQT